AQRSMVRSLTVTFAGAATFAGAPSAAFQLTGPSGAIGLNVSVNSLDGTTVTTLTFNDPSVVGGSLADGNYTLRVVAIKVTPNGRAMDGDADGAPGGDSVTSFFRLYGDVNGDRAVNGLDLTVFRAAFGTALGDPNYRDYLDIAGDGAINGVELTAF